MARKRYKKSGRDMSVKDVVEESKEHNEIEEQTVEAVEKLNPDSDKKEILEATELIKKDVLLPDKSKKEIIDLIQKEYVTLFNFENCPDSYEELKLEAKFFAGMAKYNFLLMAQRLVKIRDNELYLKDGYSHFREFIENEINLSRSTVYNYIDLVTIFEVQAFGHDEEIEHSKLIPVLPILKAENEDIPKLELKNQFLNDVKTKSYREIQSNAKELKLKYGLVKKVQKEEKPLKPYREEKGINYYIEMTGNEVKIQLNDDMKLSKEEIFGKINEVLTQYD
jgi:hypothetical protein